jgi:hypothetical protein
MEVREKDSTSNTTVGGNFFRRASEALAGNRSGSELERNGSY